MSTQTFCQLKNKYTVNDDDITKKDLNDRNPNKIQTTFQTLGS